MSAVSVAGRKAKVGGLFCLPAQGIMMISHAGPTMFNYLLRCHLAGLGLFLALYNVQ